MQDILWAAFEDELQKLSFDTGSRAAARIRAKGWLADSNPYSPKGRKAPRPAAQTPVQTLKTTPPSPTPRSWGGKDPWIKKSGKTPRFGFNPSKPVTPLSTSGGVANPRAGKMDQYQ